MESTRKDEEKNDNNYLRFGDKSDKFYSFLSYAFKNWFSYR